MKVPRATSSSHRRWYSASDPSHQTMRSGFARRATSDTHCRKPAWRTQAGAVDWSKSVLPGAFIQSLQKANGPAQAGPVGWRVLVAADSSTGAYRAVPGPVSLEHETM